MRIRFGCGLDSRMYGNFTLQGEIPWRLNSSGVLYRVYWSIIIDISKGRSAIIVRVNVYSLARPGHSATAHSNWICSTTLTASDFEKSLNIGSMPCSSCSILAHGMQEGTEKLYKILTGKYRIKRPHGRSSNKWDWKSSALCWSLCTADVACEELSKAASWLRYLPWPWEVVLQLKM